MTLHTLLKSHIELNNKIIGIIDNLQLVNNDINIPDIQRIVDDDNVDDIVNYQINYYKKYNKFNFIGLINIHCLNNKYYLIDGQHRFRSIKHLSDIGHKFDVIIEIINIHSIDELKENYKIINKNTQLPDFSDEIDKSIPETVALYFKNKYPKMWSKTSRSRKPHIYFQFFQESLGFLTEKLKINCIDHLRKLVEDYNNILSEWDVDKFPDNTKLNPKIINKCKESGLFLGLFKFSNDDIGYKWVKNIIQHHTGEIIKNETNQSKKKIPKKIKDDSWDRYIGKEYGIAFCICCNKTEIEQKNFIGGHIISEQNEGSINVDNIIPICNQCNLSMSTKNMDAFINEYYPENINNFNKKNYRTNKSNKWLNIF